MSKIIGYTTGVFDMFHIGHLNILRRAKEQCDYLIVGVSTDGLVKSYKSHLPVIPYEQRAAIVSAIKWVDEVVPQTTMDKMDAWHKIHFDVMFHGREWQGTPLYNSIEKELNHVGAKVVYLEPTNGISSTILRHKISYDG